MRDERRVRTRRKESARSRGMIEVCVRDDDEADVLRSLAIRLERREEARERVRCVRLDEGALVARDPEVAGRELRDDVGIDYHVGPWTGDLGGWRARIEHGDGLRGKEDRGYRMLRKVLRNRMAIRAFRLLHPDWGTALATRTSHTSRTYQARDGGAGLRRAATERLEGDRDLRLVIYGHSHVAELTRVGSGVYANAGSWLDQPSFLRITPERVSLLRWDEASNEGVDLDAVDRVPEKALS